MKQCREHNCPLQDICRGAVDNSTWWNISDDCEIFAFVKKQDDTIFALENRLKECENGYEGTLFLDRCKLHDAEKKVKELTEENERLRAENENKCKDCAGCISDKCDCANIEAYTVEKYKSAIIEYYSKPKYQPTKEHPIKHTQIEHLFHMIDQIAKEMLEGE